MSIETMSSIDHQANTTCQQTQKSQEETLTIINEQNTKSKDEWMSDTEATSPALDPAEMEEGEIDDSEWISDEKKPCQTKAIDIDKAQNKSSLQMAAYNKQQQQRKNRKKERRLRLQKQKKQQKTPSTEPTATPAPKPEIKLMSLLEGMSTAPLPPQQPVPLMPQPLLKIDTEPAANTLLDLIKNTEAAVVSEKENKPTGVQKTTPASQQTQKLGTKRKLKDVDKEPSKKEEKRRKFIEMRKEKAKRELEWKEKMGETVCKFYMEGRCSKGDECPFSHKVAPPPKKAELCKYYLSGYCNKNDKCTFMHAEFPCKFFHVAELKCSQGDKCRFSHALPMNEAVRDAFERYCKETGTPSVVTTFESNGDKDARILAPVVTPAPPLLSLMDLPIGKTAAKPSPAFFSRDVDERCVAVFPPAAAVSVPIAVEESRDIDERSVVTASLMHEDPNMIINKILLSTLGVPVQLPPKVKEDIYQDDNDEYLKLDIDETPEIDSSIGQGEVEWRLVPIDVEPSRLWLNPPVLANTNKNSVDQESDPRIEFYSNKANNPLFKEQKAPVMSLNVFSEVGMNAAYASASSSSALSPPQVDAVKKKTVDPRLVMKTSVGSGVQSDALPSRDVLQSKSHNGATNVPRGESGTVKLSIDDYKRKLQKPSLVSSGSSLFYNPSGSVMSSAETVPVKQQATNGAAAVVSAMSSSTTAAVAAQPKPPSYSVNLLDPLSSFSNEPQSLLEMLKNFPSS